MDLKAFNGSERAISAIGMGTYYDPFWIATAYLGWKRSSSSKITALRAGIEHGMNLIDTAEIYRSEQLVGKSIVGHDREALFIATKVWTNHLRRDALLRSIEGSLRRMDLSYVDLYQIHWPNASVPISETMRAMEELVAAGKVRAVGLSNFSLSQTKEAQAVLQTVKISSVQLDYSLLNRRIEGSILPYCLDNKIAVLAYYPLAHGKLALGRPELAPFSEKYQKTPAQVALNWLSSKPNVFPIPRASTVDHVMENLGALGWRLSEADIERLDRFFPPPPS